MIDRSPDTEYPHQTVFRLGISPLVFFWFSLLIGIAVFEQICLSIPRKRKVKYAIYGVRR